MPGVLLCCLVHQAHKESPWVGSYSVVGHISHLKEQPGWSCSVVQCVWHEREAVLMAPPPTGDSAVLPRFHHCLAILHWHFPPQSPPPHPLDLSLCSQQQPSPWDCSTIPKLRLPSTAPSRGPASLSRVCMAVARTV